MHVAQRFERFIETYRRPDGGRWGGADLERATGGKFGSGLGKKRHSVGAGARDLVDLVLALLFMAGFFYYYVAGYVAGVVEGNRKVCHREDASYPAASAAAGVAKHSSGFVTS